MNKFEFSFKNRLLKNTLELLLVALIGFLLPFWVAKIEKTNYSSNLFLSPVNAQTIDPEKAAVNVYEQMPQLPKENKYIRQETKEVDQNNTLVSRIIRYHQYVKARPTAFRLDWKLTLADYLGANETIKESLYPGYNTLTNNPLQKDTEILDSLTLMERQQLVDILVSLYASKQQNQSDSNSSAETNLSPPETPSNPLFQLPSPGGAELLLP